jgi:hypothetical protein
MMGLGINPDNDFGIWAQDRDGVLQLIVREGQQLDVDDGPGIDLRTINCLCYATPPTINNLGQVVFRAAFTDGSQGIFVSNLVAVPEPYAVGLAAIGLLTMIGSRCPRSSAFLPGTVCWSRASSDSSIPRGMVILDNTGTRQRT